ncbi:DUF3050 domain-containing protein [Streptomyces sp. NPDC101152]
MYQRMKSCEDLTTFMAHHVFAVWDLMSLQMVAEALA